MYVKSAIFICLLWMTASACGNRTPSNSPLSTSEADRQRATLQWLPWGPLATATLRVPRPSRAELHAAERWAESERDSVETDLLNGVFGKSWDLWAYARRDTDGDGVHDYRVNSSGKGRFFEGDPDLDGDGVRNVQDLDPFDPDVQMRDTNDNGIGDHIDWRFNRRGDDDWLTLCELQELVFKKFDVLLFDRTAKFPLVTAQAVADSLAIFYPKGLPALKQVAAENYAWLYPDGGETNAMVFAPNQSMMIYADSLNFDPIFQLGLIVHEMTHSYQYSMDWDKQDEASEFARTYFPMPKFSELIKPYGWTPRSMDVYEWTTLSGFASLDENKREYLYRRKTPEWWEQWLIKIWNDQGEQYLDDKRIVSKGIVGDYSLTDPLEWHADQMNAFIISVLEDTLLDSLPANKGQIMSSRLREREVLVWPAFKHANVRTSPMWERLKQQYQLSPRMLTEMSKRYLAKYIP